MKKVLIIGASGFIGNYLMDHLLGKGYAISTLTRSKVRKNGVTSFLWDPNQNQLDADALVGIDAIINLAGENIGKGFWTEKRKSEILDSRIRPAQVLFSALEKASQKPACYISSSGIAIYGIDSGPNKMTEDAPPGEGFLSHVTQQWEAYAKRMELLGIRWVSLRTGIVLAKGGGVLEQMELPIRWGIGSPIGNGQQGVSWIHMEDLCKMFAFTIEKETLSGPFNAVSPDPVSNRDFMKYLAQTLHKPFFFPSVPSIVLHTLLGEKASLVVGGNYVSADRIQNEGFKFSYTSLKVALQTIYAHEVDHFS
ncbi:MAG: TIGR01777 family oxidoreductase [Cytophagales bacterium]|nr:TIGR01777 family oxidoreductase [Cytophagales bacterium]